MSKKSETWEKLLGYRTDQTGAIFWLVKVEELGDVWKPDADVKDHKDWENLSLGQRHQLRQTQQREPQSPHRFSLDNLSNPFSRPNSPTPPASPNTAPDLPGGDAVKEGYSKDGTTYTVLSDNQFQFWDAAGNEINYCEGQVLFSKGDSGHRQRGALLSRMSWRQKRLPIGPLLWPEKCYAFTNEENPERLVCFGPYLDLGKTAKKSKKKKPQQGTRFVLVLRRVKDVETPYQLCLFRISMIDCDHPFQLIDSKEWDEHLSYLLPYSFDVSAKLLKGLFEGKTLTKQAEEEAKKVGENGRPTYQPTEAELECGLWKVGTHKWWCRCGFCKNARGKVYETAGVSYPTLQPGSQAAEWFKLSETFGKQYPNLAGLIQAFALSGFAGGPPQQPMVNPLTGGTNAGQQGQPSPYFPWPQQINQPGGAPFQPQQFYQQQAPAGWQPQPYQPYQHSVTQPYQPQQGDGGLSAFLAHSQQQTSSYVAHAQSQSANFINYLANQR
eukprot:g65157.t1